MKIEIIPAVLPDSYDELEEKIALVSGFIKTVQIDICDGQFVKNATWPYRKHDDSFEKIIKEENGLPNWQTLNYEFDLMVNHPEDIVDEWILAGAHRIIIHVESNGDINSAINKMSGKVEIGLALNTETPINAIEPYKDLIQFVQCMGIDNVGFQGQKFNHNIIDKVKSLRKIYPNLFVSVDGGVSFGTAPLLIAAGAQRLVIGSAIFSSDNAIDALQNFKRL